jgi:hypothetical protein
MKLRYALAALATIAVAAPTIASAETVVIKHRDHHDWRGARAEYVQRPFHRFHRFDRGDRNVVIINHRHHHMDY